MYLLPHFDSDPMSLVFLFLSWSVNFQMKAKKCFKRQFSKRWSIHKEDAHDETFGWSNASISSKDLSNSLNGKMSCTTSSSNVVSKKIVSTLTSGKFKCPDCLQSFNKWTKCLKHLNESGHAGGVSTVKKMNNFSTKENKKKEKKKEKKMAKKKNNTNDDASITGQNHKEENSMPSSKMTLTCEGCGTRYKSRYHGRHPLCEACRQSAGVGEEDSKKKGTCVVGAFGNTVTLSSDTPSNQQRVIDFALPSATNSAEDAYFETQLTKLPAGCCVALGFVTSSNVSTLPVDTLPGWDRHTVGVHTDDSGIYLGGNDQEPVAHVGTNFC